ncbi:hypothetical protein FA13DRAFT_1790854 [Coprinellus micaceus]|uniref:Uncharacterized protein n=1 Tax=Coprinellus micaceus TaxID=71717 RepID=A0A4Y7TEG2_COPMI|nr:hypothetical protein FA13DRAFT_1790854 [Coprinellus micaceus]
MALTNNTQTARSFEHHGKIEAACIPVAVKGRKKATRPLTNEEAKAAAYATIHAPRFKQIRIWFQNHTRNGCVTRKQLEAAARIVINDGNARPTPFLALENDVIKPEIDAAWDAESNKKDTWLEFLCKQVTDRMKTASLEKLKEVDEYRKSWNPYALKDRNTNDHNLCCLAVKPRIDKTLQGATKALTQQTGWASMMIVGGPDPETEDGQIRVSVSTQPPVDGKLTFGEWLGEDKYNALVQSFVDYLDNIYGGAEGRMEWAYSPGNELEEEPEDYLSDLDTEEDTEKVGQNAQKSRNKRPVIKINFQHSDHDSDSNDSEDGSSKKAKKDERAAKSFTYEQQHKKQIAENKAKMLEVFGTDSPSLILRDGVTAAKVTKGKERRNQNPAAGPSADDIIAQSPSSGSDDANPMSDGMEIIDIDDIRMDDVFPTGNLSGTQSVAQNDAKPKTNAKPQTPNSDTEPKTQEDDTTPEPQEDGTEPSTQKHGTEPKTNTEPKANTEPQTSTEPKTNTEPQTQKNDTKPKAQDDNAKPKTQKNEPSTQKTNTKIGALHNAGPNGDLTTNPSAKNTSKNAQGTLEGGERDENMETDVPWPAAIPGMEGAWPILTGASLDSCWRSFLDAFVAFETQSPPARKLNVAGFPGEVKAWIGSKKKAVVPDLNVSDYSARWMKWWETLQPEWRVGDTGGIGRCREVPAGANWAALCKGGTSVWEIVGDVEWVLTELGKLPSGAANRGKRPVAMVDEALSKMAKALGASSGK